MSARALVVVAVLGAAACLTARTAPTPSVPASALHDEAAPASASQAGHALDAAAAAGAAQAAGDEALQRGDQDGAISAWEEGALRASDPAPLYDRAARVRKDRAVRALLKLDGPDVLPAAARDAAACASDAHRSWAVRFPIAGAQVDGEHQSAEVYAQVGVAGAEALYLEAVCTATWARTQGFTQLVERRVEVMEALKRAAILAPDLDGAGPHRELGRLYASLPSYAGGDLAEARRELEAALARAPSVAANHLELARSVAVKSQDRALFELQVKQVADGPDKAAASEAADLLAREDDLFGTAEAAQPTPGGTGK